MIFLLYTGTSVMIINILSGEHRNIVQCSYVLVLQGLLVPWWWWQWCWWKWKKAVKKYQGNLNQLILGFKNSKYEAERTVTTLKSNNTIPKYWMMSHLDEKHFQRHNVRKALIPLAHSTLIQSISFNKLWNLGQTSAWFCLARDEKYREQLWQI